MRMLLSSLLVAQLALAAGCGGQASPVAPEGAADGPRDAGVEASIRDGAHGGPEGFYFLPPLVEEPTFSGTFDPDRSPTVEICELTDAGCEPVVATFTRETGPGSETARVDTVAEQYVVNWHTDEFGLAEGATYRIRVLLDGREAGHADVVVVTSGKELKAADTDETIALKDGRTLPIKFRIEEGLVLANPALAFPPDSVPTRFYQESNIVADPVCSGGIRFPKHIVTVIFEEGTTQAQRTEAVELVDGEVVGGLALSEQGSYMLRVDDDDRGRGVCEAKNRLNQLPYVRVASPDYEVSPLYRRPEDGEGWTEWDLDASTVDSDSATWALEFISGPLAWGCETGGDSVPVAVVDGGFHVQGIEDLEPNVDEGRSVGIDGPTSEIHGTAVASVLGAKGDNDALMTGAMWNADMRLYDLEARPGGSFTREVRGALRDALKETPAPRVINLSVGYPWGDRTPVESVAEESGDEIAFTISTTADSFDVDLPLFTIAAGNDDVEAKLGGVPQISEDFPDHVLVVGASTALGTRWIDPITGDASNTGPLVDLLAPGDNVSVLIADRQGSASVGRLSGTSFAAPLVAGTAGLMLSFDPSLGVPELRQRLLDGAKRGPHGTDSRPILNAHEALKAAPERDGAPLCGNRVWATDDAIVAEREGGTTETLQSGLGTENVLGRVEALHGGKFVSFLRRDTMSGGTTDTLVIEWPGSNGSGWNQVSIPVSDLPARRGGTHLSVFGHSHDRDTLAVIDGDTVWATRWYETEDRNEAPVRLKVPPDAAGEGTQVGTIPVRDFEEELREQCLERDADNPDTCFLATQESRFWLFRIGYPQFPSALGGRQSSVAVSPLRTVVDSTGDWEPCEFDASRECRTVTSRQKHVGALAYRMDLEGSNNRPVLLDSIAEQSIFWMGQSESGDEMVLGRGSWLLTFEADPEEFRRTGVLFTNFTFEPIDCVIEYRNRATFKQTRAPEPAPDACFFAIDFDELDPAAGGGTIAPSVRAGDRTGPRTVPMPLVEVLPEGPRLRRP